MKAVVAAFNQEKALVGAFSVITNLQMELFQALQSTLLPAAGLVFYEVCSTPVFILYTVYLAEFALMLKIQTSRCWYYINMLTCLLQLNSVGKYQDNKKFVGGRVNLLD